MELDASIRCRCFEDGKLKPGPVPVEDLYIDDEDYLCSRKLDTAYEKYGFRRFEARYRKLSDEFDEWTKNCCEHKYGDVCFVHVGNWTDCSLFRKLVEEAGGREDFPLLSELLPYENDGLYPAEKAGATLEELNRFMERIPEIEQWVLFDCETGAEIWHSIGGGAFAWRYGHHERAGLIGSREFFEHQGFPYIETARFRQVPTGSLSADETQKMSIISLESDVVSETFDSISPENPKTERKLHVLRKKTFSLYEGKFWMAEQIRKLLVLSIETGNPIRWC